MHVGVPPAERMEECGTASQQQHLTPPDTDTDTDDDTILPTVQTALTPYVRDGYNVMADG